MIYSLIALFAYTQARSSQLCLTLSIYLQGKSDDTTGIFCCGGFIIILVLIIVASISSANQQAKVLAEAKAAYQESLSKLKSNSMNADLRQRTLALGRSYSNLTRNKKGVTVFDEIALMNDINAACANAPTASRVNDVAQKKPSIEERLSKLSELKIQGLLDEEEYKSRRKKILDEV